MSQTSPPTSPSPVLFPLCVRERRYVLRVPMVLPHSSPSFQWVADVASKLYSADHPEIPSNLLFPTNVLDSHGNSCFPSEKLMERCSEGETITVEVGGAHPRWNVSSSSTKEKTLWELFAKTSEVRFHTVVFIFDAAPFDVSKDLLMDSPPHLIGNFTGWQNPLPMQHWRPTDQADSNTKVEGIQTFLQSTSMVVSNSHPLLYRYQCDFPVGAELVFKFLLPNGDIVLGPNYEVVQDGVGEKMNYYKLREWQPMEEIEKLRRRRHNEEEDDGVHFRYAAEGSHLLRLRRPSRIVLGIGDDGELAKLFGVETDGYEKQRREDEMVRRGGRGDGEVDVDGRSKKVVDFDDDNLSEDEKKRRLRLLRTSNIPEVFSSKTTSHYHAGGRKIAAVRSNIAAQDALKARLSSVAPGSEAADAAGQAAASADATSSSDSTTSSVNRVVSSRVIGSFQGVKLLDSDAEQRIFDSDWREIQIVDIERDYSKRMALKDILNKHKTKLRHIFRFYASSSGRDIQYLNVIKFLNFCKICKIVDKRCTVSRLDQIFHRVNINEEFIEVEEENGGSKEAEEKKDESNENGRSESQPAEEKAASGDEKEMSGEEEKQSGDESTAKKDDASLIKSLNESIGKGSKSSSGPKMQFHLKQPDPFNPDNQFIRGEFYESLIRIAYLKFPKLSLPQGLEKLLNQYVMPHALDQDSTALRAALLEDSVAKVLADYAEPLFSVFIFYAGADKQDINKEHNYTINIKEFSQFLDDFKLLDQKLSRVKALQAFALSQEEEIIEIMKESKVKEQKDGKDSTADGNTSMSSSSAAEESIHLTTTYEMVYPEFLELLARLASKRYSGKGDLHHQMEMLFHYMFKGDEERRRKEKEKEAEREREQKEKEKKERERKKREKEREKEEKEREEKEKASSKKKSSLTSSGKKTSPTKRK